MYNECHSAIKADWPRAANDCGESGLGGVLSGAEVDELRGRNRLHMTVRVR